MVIVTPVGESLSADNIDESVGKMELQRVESGKRTAQKRLSSLENTDSVGGDEDKRMAQLTKKRTTHTLESTAIYELTENIYTACIILPYVDKGKLRSWEEPFLNLQIFLLIIVNFAVQGTLVGFVYILYQENYLDESIGRCGENAEFVLGTEQMTWLRSICIMVYIAYCLGDLAQTMDMWIWLLAVTSVPTTDEDGKWLWTRTTFLSYCLQAVNKLCCGCLERSGCQIYKKFSVGLKIVDAEGADDNEVCNEIYAKMSNMPFWRKFYCFVIVLGLKLAVNITLIIFGTGFIVCTDAAGDLMLNALALVFILELDEMMWEFCLSGDMKRTIVDSAPRVLAEMDERSLAKWRVWSMILKCFILGLVSWLSWGMFCGTVDLGW